MNMPSRLRYIYVPAVLPYLSSSLSSVMGMAWKSGVAAELIGQPKDTIGFYLYQSKVFLDTTGQGKYRLDVYDTSGQVEISLFFDMDYKDIILRGDNIVIYNETQCLLANMNGVKRFDGDFETPYLLFAPLSGNRYLAVSQDSIDTIEMK